MTVENRRVTRIEPACTKAEAWFAQSPREPEEAWIGDQAATSDRAIAAAADLLRAAKAPLILGRASCLEGQRAAIALADRLGAGLDTGGDAAATIAFQHVGKSTCTLGEIRERVDIILCWGGDPVVSHPRLLERYSSDTRTLVVVDKEPTATALAADLHLRPRPGDDYELIAALRGLSAGIEPEATVADLPREALRDLVTRMRGCRSGVIFFGPKLTRGPVAHATVAALYSLVRELNAVTRFYVHELHDECGAEAAIAWQTGYADCVNFARGYPRSNPGEYSAEEVLCRGEADGCVLLSEVELSAAARANLAKLPVISLENATSSAAVRFTAAVPGLNAGGTAYRLDDVPIPLRAILPGKLPPQAEILARILAAL